MRVDEQYQTLLIKKSFLPLTKAAKKRIEENETTIEVEIE